MRKLFYVILLLLFFSVVNAQTSNNINNKYRLAKTYLQSGNTEKAITLLQELLATQPWNNQFLNELNKIYLGKKDYNSSIKLLNDKIKSSPSDINSYGMLGSTYYIMDNKDEAHKIWEKALTLNHGHINNYRIISNFAIQNRDFEKAIEYLREGKTTSKKIELFSYDLANIYSITMNYDSAMDEYCQLIKASPKQLDNVKRRISRLISNAEFQSEAIAVVNNYIETDGNREFYDLLAELYLQAKDYQNAYETIKILDNKNSDQGAALYTFANTANNENQFSIASAAYKLVMERYPNSALSPRAKIGFAATLNAELNFNFNKDKINWQPFKISDTTGSYKFHNIIDTYNEIIKLYPNTETAAAANFAIGKIYRENFNNLSRAEGIFRQIAAGSLISQFRPLANEQLALISIINGELEKADKNLQSIIGNVRSQNTLKIKAKFYRAKIAFWKNNFENSLELLNDLTKDLSNDYANDAIQLSLLLAALKTDSTNLSTYSKADLFIEQEKLDSALTELQKLADNPSLLLLNDLSKFNVAQIHASVDNLPKAVELLDEIIENEPKSSYSDKALYLQANTFLYGLKNKDKAIERFEKLLELFPNSLYFDRSRQIINGIKTKENRNL